LKVVAIAFAVLFTLTAVLAAHLFRENYVRFEWHAPTTLHRTSSGDGLVGSWNGAFYYMHDCHECATRERVQLDILPDSTALLVISVDTLDLVWIPAMGGQYARALPWRVSAQDAVVEGSRLVSSTDPRSAVSFELRGDSLYFDGLSSTF